MPSLIRYDSGTLAGDEEDLEKHELLDSLLQIEVPSQPVAGLAGAAIDKSSQEKRVAAEEANTLHTNGRGNCPQSAFRGVSWNRASGRWQVRITMDGKQCHVGTSLSEEDAARKVRNVSTNH